MRTGMAKLMLPLMMMSLENDFKIKHDFNPKLS